MTKSVLWIAAVPITLVLATSGCATKKYVKNQVAPVNQRVSQLQTHTNEQIAYLSSKETKDISQVNERIATTDQKVSQLATATQEAQGTASRAMEQGQANQTAIATLTSGVANALNYQLVEKADVTFAFNKSTLTPEAKAALDQVAAKAQAQPRAIIELAGFTDKIGSKSYNLALSRRRAEAVQRYLIGQKVPLRSIHIVGLGEEAPPEGLTADLKMVAPNPSRAELRRLERRVAVRVYGAGDITQGTASRSEELAPDTAPSDPPEAAPSDAPEAAPSDDGH